MIYIITKEKHVFTCGFNMLFFVVTEILYLCRLITIVYIYEA